MCDDEPYLDFSKQDDEDLCEKCKYNYAGINGLCIFCEK